jgi:hypothetical protein
MCFAFEQRHHPQSHFLTLVVFKFMKDPSVIPTSFSLSKLDLGFQDSTSFSSLCLLALISSSGKTSVVLLASRTSLNKTSLLMIIFVSSTPKMVSL